MEFLRVGRTGLASVSPPDPPWRDATFSGSAHRGEVCPERKLYREALVAVAVAGAAAVSVPVRGCPRLEPEEGFTADLPGVF